MNEEMVYGSCRSEVLYRLSCILSDGRVVVAPVVLSASDEVSGAGKCLNRLETMKVVAVSPFRELIG